MSGIIGLPDIGAKGISQSTTAPNSGVSGNFLNSYLQEINIALQKLNTKQTGVNSSQIPSQFPTPPSSVPISLKQTLSTAAGLIGTPITYTGHTGKVQTDRVIGVKKAENQVVLLLENGDLLTIQVSRPADASTPDIKAMLLAIQQQMTSSLFSTQSNNSTLNNPLVPTSNSGIPELLNTNQANLNSLPQATPNLIQFQNGLELTLQILSEAKGSNG